jgi:thiol-disulfide isomerase/thioredoxin
MISLLLSTALALADLSSLRTLEGKPVAISTKSQQLIVFWATWCQDCRSKLRGELAELDARPDVSVLTVNTDREEERVKEFVLKEKIALPVLRDSDKSLRKALGVFSVPHWAVYRRDPNTRALALVKSQAAFDSKQVREALGP